jgi:hypothetical protein
MDRDGKVRHTLIEPVGESGFRVGISLYSAN